MLAPELGAIAAEKHSSGDGFDASNGSRDRRRWRRVQQKMYVVEFAVYLHYAASIAVGNSRNYGQMDRSLLGART